jgi:hypothetical protein
MLMYYTNSSTILYEKCSLTFVHEDTTTGSTLYNTVYFAVHLLAL